MNIIDRYCALKTRYLKRVTMQTPQNLLIHWQTIHYHVPDARLKPHSESEKRPKARAPPSRSARRAARYVLNTIIKMSKTTIKIAIENVDTGNQQSQPSNSYSPNNHQNQLTIAFNTPLKPPEGLSRTTQS